MMESLQTEAVQERNCVVANAYDERGFTKYVDPKSGAKEFQETLREGCKQLQSFPGLFEDVYYSLLKFNPQLREKESVVQGNRGNLEILRKAMEGNSYQKLRSRTRGDQDLSALASMAMAKTILENLPEDVKDAINQANQAEPDEAPGGEQGGGSSAIAGLQEALEENADAIEAAVQAGLDKAKKEVEDGEAIGTVWGSGAGALQKLPWKERVELARKLRGNSKLRAIAELLGRFKLMAVQKLEERTQEVSGEVVGVELGNNLSQLTPQALSLLDDPDFGVLFDRDYTNHALLQYRVEGKETKGRGPIVVCIDESGSMRGWKDEWAKATALALLGIAWKQKRPWHCISFSSTSELEHWELRSGASEEDYLRTSIACAEHFFGGGTDYVPPLDKALVHIEESPAYANADVVFITDDECMVPAPWLQDYLARKKKLEFSIVGVLMGAGHAPTLEKFCDYVLPFTPGERVGDGEAKVIFQKVVNR